MTRFYRWHNTLRIVALLLASAFAIFSLFNAYAHTFDVELSLGIEVENNNQRDREKQDREAYGRVERGEVRDDSDYDRADRFARDHIP